MKQKLAASVLVVFAIKVTLSKALLRYETSTVEMVGVSRVVTRGPGLCKARKI